VEVLAFVIAPRALPPKRVILVAAVILGLLVGLCVTLLWSRPWLGLSLMATPQGVRITHVEGPAARAGVAPGHIHAVHGMDGARLALTPDDLIEEPDFHLEYTDYNNFLARQGALARVLDGSRVGIETDAGIHWITPVKRPPEDLPTIFWFQILCGGIAWMVGASVIANSRVRAARYYALTGAAFLLVTFTAALYSARELALDAPLFRILSIADHAGAFLFAAAFLGLLWIYPARLGNARAPWVFLAIYLGIWCADSWQWVPDMNFGIRYPMLAGLATSFVLAGLQWRRARREPINRAALKWFLLTLTVGSAVFVIGVFGMQAMGRLPVIPQGFAFGFVLMMYLGMAVGMRRYRLFNLEPWWPQLWLWFLGGVTVLVVDLALINVLVMDNQLALMLAIALAGWFYFPMRQFVLRRALRAHDSRLSELIPELIRVSSTPMASEALAEAWRDLLRQAFQPLSLSVAGVAAAVPGIHDDGLRLRVPLLDGQGMVELSHADSGRRLFQSADMELAVSLLQLLRQAVSRQEDYARGAREERARIAHDLHDDFGAKILTLIHRADSLETADRLRSILQDVRSLAASLDRAPAPLGDAIGDWRGEIADRCECAGVALDWRDALMDSHLPIHSGCRLALERVLRETVTNALKHARPSRLEVVAEDTGDELILSVADDGASTPPETWRAGLGLRAQRARMTTLRGSLCHRALRPRGCLVEIRLPKSALETV
jgi:signal transduction histidine kinase